MLYEFEGKRPQIGVTTYISPLAQVIGDVVVGESCYIGHGVILRGDYGRIVIDDETAIEEGVIVHAPPGDTQTIGRRVTIGHGAILHGKSIDDRAVIGMGAVVSLFSQVGQGSIVAEGCVVKCHQVVPDGVVVAGNPATVVRSISDRDQAMWDWGKQLYVDLAGRYLKDGMRPVPRSACTPGF